MHGLNADLTLDGTTFDTYTTTTTLNFSQDTSDVSAYGDADKEYIAGMEDATLSTSGNWDSTQDAASYAMLDGASVATAFQPDGTIDYSQNAICTQYSITAPASGAVTYSHSLQRTGGTTRT